MVLDLKLPKTNGLFISGTDTGVGKSLITGGIAYLLRQQGIKVGVFKPIASGCRHDREGLVSDDTEFLAYCADADYPLHVITPVTYSTPAAPVTCAEIEEYPVDFEAIATAYRYLCEHCDVVLVEGIGGALVPITETETILDLAVEFDLPVVIAARPNLGTINHSLLTIQAVRHAGLPVAGLVVCGYNAETANVPEETSPDVICDFGDTTLLAVVPYDPDSCVEEGRLGKRVIQSLQDCDWRSLSRC